MGQGRVVEMYLNSSCHKQERARLKQLARKLNFLTSHGKPNVSAMLRSWAARENVHAGYQDDLFGEISRGNPNFGGEE